MIFCYRLFVIPIAILLLPLAALLNTKIRQGLSLRLKSKKPSKWSSQPIWIHAASGEFEYAKSVIRECKARWPETPVVVTYFSPTYAKAIQSFKLVDESYPLPLDLPGPCRSFIKRLNPRVLMLARTDFWPELLNQARSLRVPTLVFSYTQKPVQSKLRAWWARRRLSLVDSVFCVSAVDRQEIQKLGLEAQVTGDTRYDQVFDRLSHPKPVNEALRPQIPTLIVGSSWSQDEEAVITALSPLISARRLKLILVPHEPTSAHLQELQQRLKESGLTFALYSENQPWSDKATLIVDQVGVLAELYTWADFAVIGGSFKGSVHSVMEALGVGLVTIVGPHYQNNREAYEFQRLVFENRPLVKVASAALDLKDYVAGFLDQPGAIDAHKNETRRQFELKLGATAKLLVALNERNWNSDASSAARADGGSLHP